MAWIAILDLFFLITGGAIGVLWRLEPEEITKYVAAHIDGFILFALSMIVANYISGSYRMQNTFSHFNVLVTWIFSLVVALMILGISSYAWFKFLLGRGILFLSLAWYSVFSLLFRLLFYRGLFRSRMFVCRTIVVGDVRKVTDIRRVLENEWVIPAHKIVACLDVVDGDIPQHVDETRIVDGIPVIKTSIASLDNVVRSFDVGLIALTSGSHEEAMRLFPKLRRMRFEGIEVISEVGLAETYVGRIRLDLVDEDYLMDITMESGLPVVSRFKRLLDIIASTVMFIVFLPVMLVVMLVLKLTEPGAPIFYWQDRVGQFGEIFRIYKFRTMRVDAETESGPVWAEPDDARITKVGKFLRKFRLDELPQLINILKGEMSLVGPRPERPEIMAELDREIHFYAERLNVMPGLTGWAQIRHPYGNSIEDAKKKLEFDLYYMKHLSLSLDMQIILSTIRIMLFGKERNV